MTDKSKILIVDDSEINRSLLADMLEKNYEILEASNGVKAISVIDKLHEEIALVLLDIVMPEMDGFAVLELMNKNGWINDIPVVIISAETSSGNIDKAYNLGVTDYISRPFDENTVLRRANNTIMLYSKQKRLEQMVDEQIREKEHSSTVMLEMLSNIVEFRNGESGAHVLNIRIITELLLKKLVKITDKYPLTAEDIRLIVNASSLHDIGKISIPEEILNKPGKLTEEEFNIMKTHSEIGAKILEQSPNRKGEKLTQKAIAICRWHHERYDGRGYPDGLKGDEIPIEAQVVSLADVYDALTHTRVYKPAFSHETAYKMILNGECGAFSPLLIQCLTEIGSGLQKALQKGLHDTAEGIIRPIQEPFSGGGDASSRTLALLERERTKYRFFASMSNEIQFEYSHQTDLLSLSEWGAEQLGLSELIVDPGKNSEFNKVFRIDDFINLTNKLSFATPKEPVVNAVYCLTVKGQPRWYKIVARPLWANDEDMDIVGTIGKLIDVHDEYTELFKFKKRAEQDSLTKLQNHHTARENIKNTLLDGRKAILILLDLDDFKSSNDKFGHLFGDEVLRYVAKNILYTVREGDIAARIGGDEFLVFAVCEEEDDPVSMAKVLLENFPDSYKGFPISVSMGIVCTPEYGTDYNDLFCKADRALYMAKQNGKHRFCFYDDAVNSESSVHSPIDSDSRSNNFSDD